MSPLQDNVVIDEEGRANLCDFGMTTLVHSLNSINPSTRSSLCGTVQYMAPEMIDPEQGGLQNPHPSLEVDIYALAILMWQVRPNSHSSL